ncbi:hypothetical protein A2397_03960 [Candidatus Amesbacteria bacterium RIFOXYB1_FULL_44_23]|uniref:UDP-N-acetylmuramoyl-tripeptide--D-alanyl-D-alanine ligase n=1 Tax=Candidatus Amesbacteria bacterium RIFOXYB1_FULL_44_23 TaxID=1797263 RepID=A0A1F4ZUM4_9BACT|nr:MAG: hypothetical protein A2397_03960 [Candidatus Amesbacteria bacterium RIFOXYB1_FULL_44_23]
MKLNLLRLWTGPLPIEELFPGDRKINPLLHWFIHPLKRRIAKYYLLILQNVFGLKVVALTGSAGKTTTSNLLYSVLNLVGSTIKTSDSTTTTYNLPTTILKCTPSTKFLILEMGVEYKGDMDFYCWLAKPDIGVFLNVSSVHSAFLGSLDDIKTEKYNLFNYSKISLTPDKFPKVISSKISQSLTSQIKCQTLNDQLVINLPLLGTHFAQNVSAVIAVCLKLGIPLQFIKQGLETSSPPLHRMNVIYSKNGNIILDDSYNANPLSVNESLKTLSEVSKIKKLTPVFVFGQMNELGQYEKADHEKIGVEVKKIGVKKLFCIGPATKSTIQAAGFGKYYDSSDSLFSNLKKFETENSDLVILIKGSHSWHLEKLVSLLTS